MSIFGDGRGFTMAELLVAALFALIVVGTLYGFYRQQLLTLHSEEVRTATLEDTRGALDIMVRELRNAGAWTSGSQPGGCQRIVTAIDAAIRTQADLNGDGDCDSATSAETGEDVTYELASATSTCPGKIIRRKGSGIDPGQCLVANVVIPAGSSFLTYYDTAGAVLTPPIADFNAIRRVKITFAVEVANPHPDVGGALLASTLSSSVEFRN